MCCCISGDPIQDERFKTFETQNKFQASMLEAPFKGGVKTCLWCTGQFFPLTCGITQFFLRRKVLENDMKKYSCFQGYFNVCCVGAGCCGEEAFPTCCLCLEACFCNSCAISASRLSIMERYDLSSDQCDYRLIRINNCLQILGCLCAVLSIFCECLQECSRIINFIADIFYHCVSGCMTAQVAYEADYQHELAHPRLSSPIITATPVSDYKQ